MSNLGNLRDTINRAVSSGVKTITTAQYPPLDIYRTENNVVVQTAPIDGLDPASIQVEMNGSDLTISGSTQDNTDVPAEAYLRRERTFGAFSRTITVPVNVKANEASARFKNNVLMIRLPLSDADRSEIIAVQVAD